ncbi:hypothetical protein [Solimonas flava]|uniref:hypothetical protein n=1 Tax=Solimonas flava TaxID=415849 RepID=UPI00040BFF65|nr:hypothetical protein [Solimonas flava]
MNDEPDLHAEDEAPAIVAGARRRALGGRREFQQISAVLWASFLGASVSLITLLLLPAEGWLPLKTPARVAIGFAVLWLLAVVPALIAAVLATPVERGDQRGTR